MRANSPPPSGGSGSGRAMQYRLGIVLSGGGSRGLAHGGVLRALDEAGIQADCVAGTSSGALVGALYAAGHPAEEVVEFFEVANPFRLSHLALRKPGWIDSEKIGIDFARWFPADSFEALGKRLFVAATDLISGKGEIFSSGELIRPLVASASIPFIFTPVAIGTRRFVDGGIINNFPVEPLSGLCDVIIGVHASPLSRAGSGEFDSTFAVTQRALEIGMYHASKRKFHHAALVLEPAELAGYSTFDTRRHKEIVEIGYRAAMERMDEIRALVGGG
jgi:NTE family protein